MAGVVVTMSGDEAKLFRALQKVVDQQDKVNKKFKESERASEQAGRRASESFNKSTTSMDKLTAAAVKYAASVASISAAVQLVKTAWEQVRSEQEKGLSQLQRTQVQDRRLLQVSGSAEEFTQLRNQADQLASQFGVDRDLVRNVIASAIQEGFTAAVPGIIAANQVVDPMTASVVAGQIPVLFKQTIGALESVDLALKAANDSRLEFDQLARALPAAAEGGSIAKASVEETMAILAVLAAEFKSGEVAADRMKAFGVRTGISGEFGPGFLAPLQELMAMDEQTRRAFLGTDQEMNVAYTKMADNFDKIQRQVAALAEERRAFAEGTGILAQRMAIAGMDPQFAALMLQARARQQMEAQEAGMFGAYGGIESAARDIATTRVMSDTLLTRMLNSTLGLFLPTLSMAVSSERDPQIIGGASASISRGIAEILTNAGNPIGSAIDRFSKAVESFERATNTLQANGGAPAAAARAQAAAATGGSF